MYTIFIAKNTQKQFSKLPTKTQENLKTNILSLKEFPNLKNIKKLTDQDPFWRLKSGKYRVIFAVEKESQLIKITHIRQRNEKTYKQL